MIKPHYNKEALLKGIENCDRNIKIFKDAIKKERKTKKKFQRLVDELVDGVSKN